MNYNHRAPRQSEDATHPQPSRQRRGEMQRDLCRRLPKDVARLGHPIDWGHLPPTLRLIWKILHERVRYEAEAAQRRGEEGAARK